MSATERGKGWATDRRQGSRTLWLAIAIFSLLAAGTFVMTDLTDLPGVGAMAPDFSWTDSAGIVRRLSDERGKHHVLLSFYPRDFTPGCTRQLCSYRDAQEELRTLGAVVLAVSYDSPQSHAGFAATHHFPFSLISDPDRIISTLYGARRLWGLWPLPKRVSWVIDRRGVIRRVMHHEFAVERHLEEAVETLRSLAGEKEALTLPAEEESLGRTR